jgi:hypothetical protein
VNQYTGSDISPIPRNENDTVELLRIQTEKCAIYRAQYLTAHDNARQLALRDARHEFERIVNELRSHHMDAVESALLDIVRQRYNEILNLLTPRSTEVPQSGK